MVKRQIGTQSRIFNETYDAYSPFASVFLGDFLYCCCCYSAAAISQKKHRWCTVVMATGLSRPGKSWEGPGTGRDRVGPRDLEGPVVLWSRD